MNDLWNSLVSFCDYQERCKADVVRKMTSLGVKISEFDTWIRKLEAENLINEERFVRQFINSRFRNKKWGKEKIEQALSAKGVANETIQNAFNELIDEDTYISQLQSLALKKVKTIKANTVFEKKWKLMRYLQSKGYSSKDARAVSDQIINDTE